MISRANHGGLDRAGAERVILERRAAALDTGPSLRPGESLPAAMARIEMEIIADTLARCGDNKSEAAKALGIAREMLHRKLAGGRRK